MFLLLILCHSNGCNYIEKDIFPLPDKYDYVRDFYPMDKYDQYLTIPIIAGFWAV